MGCGSSKAEDVLPVRGGDTKRNDAEDNAKMQIDLKLASHISTLLGIAPESTEVKGYVAALRLEGWDTPDDFEDLAVDELKAEPFCWKPGHLKKVSRSRSRAKDTEKETNEGALQRADISNLRGQCTLCGLDVYDTQPRLKDPDTGLYQHENCHAAKDKSSPPHRASLVVSELAISKAKEDAATAAEEAHLEVAAIKAAAEKARAAVIAEAKQQAEAALEEARKKAEQIAAAGIADCESMSAISELTQSQSSTVPAAPNRINPSLPAGPKIKALLPDGKHAFLSYQWDVQEQVKDIKARLEERSVKCWMDVDGGMKSNIYDSMAEGLQGAACVICFMTQAYQDSANCKLELQFAQQSGVPIIPVMMQADFAAKGWLGILTSGSIWTPMHDPPTVPDGIAKLISQAQHLVPGMHGGDADTYSEVSSEAGSSFDVGVWGDDIFSLAEMRDELERLREDTAPSAETARKRSYANAGSLCSLPAMVPTLPRGLFVTAAMQSVLDAVLSEAATSQIGFCGMGGIGKTTVSCWVARSDAVRTKFGMIAWITLGQTPVLALCMDLLHRQLAGSAFPDGLAIEQKHEILQQAFLNQSVLLVLDDCWDATVIKHFNWIDQSTDSKILISSRVRDVLDGGQTIDVTVPSKMDAVKMLLSTAGMDDEALSGRKEVAHIAELCKRLPLTIGVAGKLIRQLAHGSEMSEASEWSDVVALLEEELNDPDGSMSIEESVIRASIKAIPKKLRKNVLQLFLGFSLVPEDTFVPLPVLGMVFHACTADEHGKAPTATKPLSRMQVRRYLKVLIDRSLVLGTVDRPQLHDVMLDYVRKQLAGDAYKAAQRKLVESLRQSDRSRATPTGKYLQQCVKHHVKESYDATWERSAQAISWIEDHASGVQDVIAASAAAILPVEELAKQAEAAEMWVKAALRWNAIGLLKRTDNDNVVEAALFIKLAVNASAKAVVAKPNSSSDVDVVGDAGFTQFALDLFDLTAFKKLFHTFDPALLAEYGSRYRLASNTEAGQSRPLMRYSAMEALDFFPAMLSGNEQMLADASWQIIIYLTDICNNVNSSAYAQLTEEERSWIKPIQYMYIWHAGDAMINSPGFSWATFENGDKIMDSYYSYVYEQNHAKIVELTSADVHIWSPEPFILAVQFGRVDDAHRMVDDQFTVFKTCAEHKASAGYIITLNLALAFGPQIQHMLGLPQHVQKLFALVGLTFDNAVEWFDQLTKFAQGTMVAAYEHKGTDGYGGMGSLTRIVWQAKAMCILDLEVPEAKAVAWLESLPDNNAYYAYTMVFPTHDVCGMQHFYAACWIALAHEKVGLLDGAIRFADLQLEPDMLKGGTPLTKWPQVVALACKGRVFAKQNRHDEALAAFQAAIAVSKQSYSLMEAFALRELANYVGIGEAAVQAAKDLEAKVATFKGRMTRAEFDGMTIAPGLNQTIAVTAQPSSTPLTSATLLTKPLLPDGKHAFLSYQWDVQDEVKEIKEKMNQRNVKCWMDVDGGMKSNIYDSMAEGLQGAACVVCFMTQAYQDSANCKLELQFAQQSGVPIIPVMMQANFTAKGWLGILTSGSIWTPMHDPSTVPDGVDKVIEQAQHLVPGMRSEDKPFSDTSSDAGSSFDVGAWGDNMFSLDEMRGELDRLREDSAPLSAGPIQNSDTNRSGVSLCVLPAMVPTLPQGLFITAEMNQVLDAVLSDTSTPQIGFCGMGGIGKTTVSCWVTRNNAVRTKFGMVAWITLGQTPLMDSCIDLLHMQLTSTSLPDGLSPDQKNEHLKQAFLDRSVLLILDDCWDKTVAKQFAWIDHSTNSKILISSRVRDVLGGGQIINVAVPSKSDAVKMLLSTAGLEIDDVLQGQEEVAQVAELCKRLPLTIGVAGKLIRQLADGSSMSEASEWTDILALLEDEMDDPDGSLSVEESVIRASVKAIPKKIQKQVTRLFYGFSLVPEDTHVPLPVLGMIYHACGDDPTTGGGGTTKPLSRMQVRRYLKVLIDRSLVLGTVDRPQLHDVMLDYVQKELAGEAHKAAQRRLVEAFRTTNRSIDRSAVTVTEIYFQQCVQHHIKESHDESWAKGEQAISWIEDHVNGVQNSIASVTAAVLPVEAVEALAKEAEAAEMWWNAALRWYV